MENRKPIEVRIAEAQRRKVTLQQNEILKKLRGLKTGGENGENSPLISTRKVVQLNVAGPRDTVKNNVVNLPRKPKPNDNQGDVFGRLIKEELPGSVLVLPDMQAPFQHIDALPFLKAVADEFQPECVVCIGDELDNNSLSDFVKHPDLPGAERELEAGRKFWEEVFREFPVAHALHSNHGQGRLDKAQMRSGLISSFMPAYRQLIGAPDGWQWFHEVRLGPVLFHHGHGKGKLSPTYLRKNIPEDYGTHYSVVHGHRHSLVGRQGEVVVGDDSYWAAYTGCLINRYSKAFGYTDPVPTKLGCGVILYGEYLTVRMRTNEIGRWVGHL